MPEGLEVTEPVPSPAKITLNGNMPLPKVAVTDFDPSIFKVHVIDVPVHDPPHPAN